MAELDEGHPRRLLAGELNHFFDLAGPITNDRIAGAANHYVRIQRVPGLSKEERDRYRPVAGRRISEWRNGKSVPASWSQLAAVLTVLAEVLRRNAPDCAMPELGRWRAFWLQATASSKSPPGYPISSRRSQTIEQGDAHKYAGADVPLPPDELEALLARHVYGQDAVIGEVARLVFASSLRLSFVADGADVGRGPRCTLLLAGPVGSGKRQLAGALADTLFGGAMIRRFFMGEFAGVRSCDLLFGTPPSEGRQAGPGLLSEWIQASPRSVLVFEEIERAHPTVMDSFFQLIEDGRLTDGLGRVNSFQDSILVFTTNVGAAEFADPTPKQLVALADHPRPKKFFQDAVRRLFVEELGRPELHTRLAGNVVVFDIIRAEMTAARIARRHLDQLAARVSVATGFTLSFDRQEFAEMVVQRAMRQPFAGGRAVGTWLEQLVTNPLVRWLSETRMEPGSEVVLRFMDGAANFSRR